MLVSSSIAATNVMPVALDRLVAPETAIQIIRRRKKGEGKRRDEGRDNNT